MVFEQRTAKAPKGRLRKLQIALGYKGSQCYGHFQLEACSYCGICEKFAAFWRPSQGDPMRKLAKSCATALMLTCMAGNVWAATTEAAGCARPEDMTAIKAAAVQQRLMVAALSCNAIQLYNKFVTSYQKELQNSDQALQNFFRRLNGKTGTADYHAFKTRLANTSSLQSIGDITAYCASTKEVFDTALSPAKITLAGFVSGQTTSADNTFSPCQVRTAGAAAPTPPPQNAPLPRSKPAGIAPA